MTCKPSLSPIQGLKISPCEGAENGLEGSIASQILQSGCTSFETCMQTFHLKATTSSKYLADILWQSSLSKVHNEVHSIVLEAL